MKKFISLILLGSVVGGNVFAAKSQPNFKYLCPPGMVYYNNGQKEGCEKASAFTASECPAGTSYYSRAGRFGCERPLVQKIEKARPTTLRTE